MRDPAPDEKSSPKHKKEVTGTEKNGIIIMSVVMGVTSSKNY